MLVHNKNISSLSETVSLTTQLSPSLSGYVFIFLSLIGYVKEHPELIIKLDTTRKINSHLDKMDKEMFIPMHLVKLYHFPHCIIEQRFWGLLPGKTLSDKQVEFPNKVLFDQVRPIR